MEGTADGGLEHDLKSDRLILRNWRDSDFAPFAATNADAATMQYYPTGPLTDGQSRERAETLATFYEPPGFRHWIIEARGTATFVGMIALKPVTFRARFVPAVEIGWRLSRDLWGHGYATEAARTVFRHGFSTCGLDEIVAFTSVTNTRSRALMERLGMSRDPDDDFLHPEMDGHELQPHVLYRLRKDDVADD